MLHPISRVVVFLILSGAQIILGQPVSYGSAKKILILARLEQAINQSKLFL